MSDIETHPLPPFLPPNAKLLMLGSFPPPATRWKMNFYYPNYQNDMWRIFGLIFFQNKDYFLDIENKKFQESLIRKFLLETGIAIFDSASQIRRLTGNASDKFLEIVVPTNLKDLLLQIPECTYIMTTGDKATDTMMLSMPEDAEKPKIGEPTQTNLEGRELHLYRMPSSSRAYPLALDRKAEAYRQLFLDVGLV
ncbi:uracil-DNA glycosylase family protein [Acinetobacter pseudolwoffii]|uniref:uracil-DNA glycosylase family protein n=1 Tax=Acinetobacter pseudolwoffii TaxID=2053287 RepID=UPI002576F2C0|nr:uracil-DNA glycosylase family protein [Acinetobacter pseudolwoffii]MDM1323833.1 uracil-DNA glycosylase family protein [Acinetobacter pseudolwoffii]